MAALQAARERAEAEAEAERRRAAEREEEQRRQAQLLASMIEDLLRRLSLVEGREPLPPPGECRLSTPGVGEGSLHTR
jgi:hypothetical protein